MRNSLYDWKLVGLILALCPFLLEAEVMGEKKKVNSTVSQMIAQKVIGVIYPAIIMQ